MMALTPALVAQTAKPQPHPHKQAAPQSITCFAHPHETAIEHKAALSTVMLVSLGNDGEQLNLGSGVVTANSVVNPDWGNRILTDAHVLGIRTGEKDGLSLSAYDPTKRILLVSPSTGSVLAEVKPVVLGTTDISSNLRDDQTVLEVSKFYPGGETSYRSIPGLKLARYQSPSGVVDAQLVGKAGTDEGASGGPAIDSSGNIIGLIELGGGTTDVTISRPRLVSFAPARHIERHGRGVDFDDYTAYRFDGDPVTRHTVALNGNNIPFMESIINPRILSALGPAGEGITAKSLPNEKGELLGMPKGACVRYPASMLHQVDVNDLNEFYFPSQPSLTPVDFWRDLKKPAAYLGSLLEQANETLHNPLIDEQVSALKQTSDFTPYLKQDYAQFILDCAQDLSKTQPKDTSLLDKLIDAGHNIDDLSSAMSVQKKFQPKIAGPAFKK